MKKENDINEVKMDPKSQDMNRQKEFGMVQTKAQELMTKLRSSMNTLPRESLSQIKEEPKVMPPSADEVIKNIEKKKSKKEEKAPEDNKQKDNQITLFTEVQE